MNILLNTILVLIYVLAPAAVLKLCKKQAWAKKIGPILILYILGVILGNLGLIHDTQFLHPTGMAKIQDLLSSAMVPIAIPLMLYGCTFRKSETRNQLLALITGIVAVVTAVICGYLIFGHNIENGSKIGGMLTGVYTGGTMNLAALKTMLGVSEETYLLLNSYDMIISFLFLTFLLSIGIKLFRKFLPVNAENIAASKSEIKEAAISDESKPALWSKEWWKQAGILIGITIAIIGVSAGIALVLPDGMFMTVFILLLTTLGIAASFIPMVRKMKIAEDISMYCIYIFSIVVASMADLATLDFAGSLNILGYLAVVVFGSFLIQVLLAKICRIDADTVIISSTAFICSPPFVPMMATAMKNRSIVIGGLSIGIIGYAVGNYLGFLISQLLSLF